MNAHLNKTNLAPNRGSLSRSANTPATLLKRGLQLYMTFIFALLALLFSSMMRPGYALRHASIAISKESANTKVIVIVGGGAAGYFSAIECARLLQEKNVPSKVG